jgi:hypothetical protein
MRGNLGSLYFDFNKKEGQDMAAKKNAEVVDTQITEEQDLGPVAEPKVEAPEKEPETNETAQTEAPKAEEPKKEGFFKKVGNAWNGFEEKHPKFAKGLKIGGALAAAGTVGYVVAKVTDKKDDATPEIPTADPTPMLGCDDSDYDYYDNTEYDVADTEIEAEPVETESTVEITEF